MLQQDSFCLPVLRPWLLADTAPFVISIKSVLSQCLCALLLPFVLIWLKYRVIIAMFWLKYKYIYDSGEGETAQVFSRLQTDHMLRRVKFAIWTRIFCKGKNHWNKSRVQGCQEETPATTSIWTHLSLFNIGRINSAYPVRKWKTWCADLDHVETFTLLLSEMVACQCRRVCQRIF